MDTALLQLSPEEYSLVIKGLDALKAKGPTDAMMFDLFESIIASPKKDASEKEKKEWEEKQKKREEQKKEKALVQEKFNDEIDIIKSKLILMKQSFTSGNNISGAN